MSGANTGLEAVHGVLVDTGFLIRLLKAGGFGARIAQLNAAGHQLRMQLLDLNVPMAEALGRLNFPE